MRQDTAPQPAILFDGTRAHAVYTCQQSQFLADWQHQQVNRTAHRFSPLRWAASGQRQVKEASGGQRYTGSGRNRAGQGLWYLCTRMLTPLIDGLGLANYALLFSSLERHVGKIYTLSALHVQ